MPVEDNRIDRGEMNCQGFNGVGQQADWGNRW